MADRKKQNKVNMRYEDEPMATGTPVKVILSLVCFGIAALTIYLAVAVPQMGTAMGSIKDVIRGISGDIPYLLSIVFIWIGILFIGSAGNKKIRILHVIAYSIMFLSLFAAFHIFSAESLIHSMNVDSYAQFLGTSFRMKCGGGILGAVFSYYLFKYLGAVGGCAACVLIIFIALVATGKASKMFSWGQKQAVASRRKRDEREKRRIQENRHMFDRFAEGEEERNTIQKASHGNTRYENPVQQARRRQANKTHIRVSDPERDSIYIANPGDVDPDRRRAATQAFYDPETDEELPRSRQRKDGGIQVPKSISKMRGGTVGNARGRTDSDRRVRKKNIDEMTDTEKASSVSADAMSAVAEHVSRKERKPVSPASGAFSEKFREARAEKNREKQAEITEIQEVTEVAEVDPDDLFEPVSYEATSSAPKRVVEGTRGLLDEGISREKKKPHVSFVETDDPEYNYPPIDLLERGDKGESVKQHEISDQHKAEKLIETLKSFGINTKLSGIAHGPAVTRFELQPEAGIKVSRITSLADDIALSLAAETVRIEAPIPGKPAVGVEIPNDKIEMVRLRDVLESKEALNNTSKIAIGLGKDNSGRYVVADIAKMPHVLIAGQTGSGKSVCINSIITSILYRATPEDVRLILIDPKVVELSIYNDIPHLIAPVVTDPKKAASALQWAVAEMLERYKKFSQKGVRNIKGYNAAIGKDEKKMPQMVIIIDELADLMMAAPGEVEDSICRIAQLARAAGMHLVIATQRPSVNVITGIIKANIPTRIAFAVASLTDSRVMIDHGGAEKLLGNGDMLFVPNGGKTLRVQGTWVSDDEVNQVVSYIKERCDTNYDEDVQEKIENSVKSDAEIEDANNELDDRLAEAVEIVVEAGQASVSMLQRRMRVGYARAGRLIDEMQKRGIVSEADGAKPRSVLMTREQFRQMFGEEI